MVDLDLLEQRLLAAAAAGQSVTYGELLAFFERRVTPITVRALCRDIGKVDARVMAAGGPELACLVVRASDRLPGAGYFHWHRENGRYTGPDEGPPAARYVAEAQAKAHRYARRRLA